MIIMYNDFYTILIIFGFISIITANYDPRYLRHGSQKNEIDGGTCAEFKRLNAMDKCCEVRDDDCYMIHYDTRCYCDVFCDREMMNDHSDCCPDAAQQCSISYVGKNDTKAPIAKKGCRANDGRMYNHDEISKENCNQCQCSDGVLKCSNLNCLINVKLLDEINRSRRNTWKASNYSMFWGKTLDFGYTHKLGALKPNTSQKALESEDDLDVKYYDFRNIWDFSRNRKIEDQGNCGGSWAFSAAGVLSDRLGKTDPIRRNMTVSVEMILSCIENSDKALNENGCLPRKVDNAWYQIYGSYGLVDDECYPFQSGLTGFTQACAIGPNLICPSRSNFERQKIIKSSLAYPIRAENSNDIMTEIYQNGPVQVVFKVYEDFFMYKSGIYKPSENAVGNETIYHSVKLLGWGTENNVDYWIAANSWGEDWGENGYFRIVRDDTGTEFGRHVFGVSVSRKVNTRKNNRRMRKYRSRYRNRVLKYKKKLRKYKQRI